MRKIKITKQQTVNPKAVYMGLSIVQMIIMGLGILLAIGTFILFYFTLQIDVNITMTLVFIELVASAGFSIVRINGMNLFKYISTAFKAPIYRPFRTKGMMDTYEKTEKK